MKRLNRYWDELEMEKTRSSLEGRDELRREARGLRTAAGILSSLAAFSLGVMASGLYAAESFLEVWGVICGASFTVMAVNCYSEAGQRRKLLELLWPERPQPTETHRSGKSSSSYSHRDRWTPPGTW